MRLSLVGKQVRVQHQLQYRSRTCTVTQPRSARTAILLCSIGTAVSAHPNEPRMKARVRVLVVQYNHSGTVELPTLRQRPPAHNPFMHPPTHHPPPLPTYPPTTVQHSTFTPTPTHGSHTRTPHVHPSYALAPYLAKNCTRYMIVWTHIPSVHKNIEVILKPVRNKQVCTAKQTLERWRAKHGPVVQSQRFH